MTPTTPTTPKKDMCCEKCRFVGWKESKDFCMDPNCPCHSNSTQEKACDCHLCSFDHNSVNVEVGMTANHGVPHHTSFSDFFHNASPEEKERVMLEVAREATNDQRKQVGLPPLHTSPEKEYGQPEHKGNGDTIGSLKKLAEVMQEEVSQEKEPSYIDQVVEEFRNSFANAGGDYDGPLTPLETFLREKLKTNIEREVRIAYDCAVYVLPSGEILTNPKEAAYEAGKTAERQRIREMVEGIIDQNDDGMWSGREILDDLLARLSED